MPSATPFSKREARRRDESGNARDHLLPVYRLRPCDRAGRIARLCTPAPDYADAVWGQAFLRSRVILEEGGVEMHFVATDESAAKTP